MNTSYTKQTVNEMFNGNGNLRPHQKDFLEATMFMVKLKPEGFTFHDVHKILVDYCGRPETSNYNSFLTVLVDNNLLIKDENKVYTPSALFKFIVGR
jgi:hypothetical protein